MGLVLVAAFASYLNPLKKSPPKAKADREYERRITGERLSARTAYYAEVSRGAVVVDGLGSEIEKLR